MVLGPEEGNWQKKAQKKRAEDEVLTLSEIFLAFFFKLNQDRCASVQGSSCLCPMEVK